MITLSGNNIHKSVWYYIRVVFKENIKIVVVDAANRFDPYLISKLCVNMGISPYIVLENIFIARAFTPFQMLKLIENVFNIHQKANKKFLFILLGITELLDDDNIPYVSSMKILKKSLFILTSIKFSIITMKNSHRRNFYETVKNSSHIFIEDKVILKPDNLQQGVNKIWAGQLHHLHMF